MGTARSKALFAAARRVLPGGVNSPVRAFGAVGGEPLFMAAASGAQLTDVDGNTYIDFLGSWGPMILGHTQPEVVAAIQAAAGRGTSFGTPTAAETELARLIVGRIPSVEKVRFVNSGTEATMSAVRLARGATGRSKLIKFEGCYHGHGDSLLIKAGSGALTTGVPSSSGVPPAIAGETLVAQFNELSSVEALFEAHGDRVAAVIVEPVAGNMGCVPGEPGFLMGLREFCTAHGALLIFDEVMTGFRVHPQGAQGLYGIQPDLTTLGKVIGGGLPVGAYGGRRDLMAQVAPEGPVYQAGTLSGNPLAMAAGIATLERCDEALYLRLEQLGKALETSLQSVIQRHGGVTVNRVGSMFTLFFTDGPVRTYADVMQCDLPAFGRFFHLALEQGLYLPPSQFEAAFISGAHTPADGEQLVATLERFLATA